LLKFSILERIPLDLNQGGFPKAVWLSESIGIDSPVGATTMPKSLSGDLRERVIEAVQAGASRREAAERFEISASCAVKWLQRWRDHGEWVPKARGGSRSVLEDYAERILALIDEQPDRTLDELVMAMHKRRIPGSRGARNPTTLLGASPPPSPTLESRIPAPLAAPAPAPVINGPAARSPYGGVM
jgi:hypothetical protein